MVSNEPLIIAPVSNAKVLYYFFVFGYFCYTITGNFSCRDNVSDARNNKKGEVHSIPAFGTLN